MNHFVENGMSVVLSLLMNSFVYSFPTLVLIAVFALGRVTHQIGYANYGYGGHGLGFVLSTVSTEALNGLLLLTTLKGFKML